MPRQRIRRTRWDRLFEHLCPDPGVFARFCAFSFFFRRKNGKTMSIRNVPATYPQRIRNVSGTRIRCGYGYVAPQRIRKIRITQLCIDILEKVSY